MAQSGHRAATGLSRYDALHREPWGGARVPEARAFTTGLKWLAMLKEIAPQVTYAALLGNRKASGAGRCSFLSGRASGAGPRQAIASERKPGATTDSTPWLKVKNPEAPAVKREEEEDWGR